MLLVTILTYQIQAHQHRRKNCVDCEEDYLEKHTSFSHILRVYINLPIFFFS